MPNPVDPQDQRTVLMPRRDVDGELAVGRRLQEYVVQSTIGVGGYSIVYRVHDTLLDRSVAMKEYIPAALALRNPAGEVYPRTPRHREHFELGLRSFVKEARLLASFDHPALVKVYRYWEENGTAYMVMPFYQGMTLKRWLVNLGTAPSEAWLRLLAGDLIDALASIHAQNCYHRDVAPDNILMLFDKHAGPFLEQRPRPLLLDFGAARRVIGDATQNLTAILKSGYSPIEQYGSTEAMRQGAWTDVYALCAVLYMAVAGRAPPSAVARIVKDDMVAASTAGVGRYSKQFLRAIDAGLAVRPEHRPQSMVEFRECLTADHPVFFAKARAEAATKRSEAKQASAAERIKVTRGQTIVAASVAVAALAAAAWRWLL